MRQYAHWIAAIFGWLLVSPALACKPSMEFLAFSIPQRAKWLYERANLVAHVRVTSVAAEPARPPVALVEPIEVYKGARLTSISTDMSTCGFELKEGQEFIAFLHGDGGTLRWHFTIPKNEMETAVPTLRQLRMAK